MIIDFQHHFTPRALFPDDYQGGMRTVFDAQGVPAYSFHGLLHDLDQHVAMMDAAGIDLALLTCAEGMCAGPDKSRLINDEAFKAGQDYPRRFGGLAHAHPLGGADAFAELARCRDALGFPGVVITTEFDGRTLDDPALDPFWGECERLGLYVFIHPALRLIHPEPFDAYDLGRSVGREFSLVMAVIRLINGGVLDRFPGLVVQFAHLGGGIASVLGRVRSYQDKTFWGTAGNPRHGVVPRHDLDHYIRERLYFDTAGFCGDIRSVKTALVEIPASRIVFATDYPQEIREPAPVARFVQELRALGADGAAILETSARDLVGDLVPA